MLLALVLTCTPKHFLHDLFANHHHEELAQNDKAATYSKNLHCNFDQEYIEPPCELIVVLASQVSVQYPTYQVRYVQAVLQPTVRYNTLRGPPNA